MSEKVIANFASKAEDIAFNKKLTIQEPNSENVQTSDLETRISLKL